MTPRHVLFLCAAALAATAFGCGDDGGGGTSDVVSDVQGLDPAVLEIDRGDVSFGTFVLGVESGSIRWVVKNDGQIASGPMTVDLSGSEEFVVTSNFCSGQLGPGQSCALTIVFRPVTAGPHSASFAVSASPGGSVGAAVDGEGILDGALSIEIDEADLGRVNIGLTSPTIAHVTMRNTGVRTTGPIVVYMGGDNPGDFPISDGCKGVALAQDESCSMTASFKPRQSGAKSTSIEARATPGGHVSVTVVGIGLAPAALYSTVKEVDFGVSVLGVEVRSSITLSNLGETPTGTIGVALEGQGAPSYDIDGCDGEALSPGGVCIIDVVFLPAGLGTQAATLTISAAPGGTMVVPLAGSGVSSLLDIDPGAARFDSLLVGTRSEPATFIVTNEGLRTSGVLTVERLGDASSFELVEDGCHGKSLGPAAGCRLRVVFIAVADGPASAEMVISGPTSGRASADLDGVGLPSPLITLTPPDHDFGAVPLERDSKVERLVVGNDGGFPTGLVDVALDGANADQFEIVSNGCVARVLPGDTCEVAVRFAPTVIGTAEVALVVTSEPGGSAFATLTGEAVSPDQLQVDDTYAFDPIVVFTNESHDFIVLNDSAAATGSVLITKSGLHAGDFAITEDCNTLGPHASCTLTVVFTPRGSGTRNASINVSANPGGAQVLTLSGVGLPVP